jgi:hypothetical protein
MKKMIINKTEVYPIYVLHENTNSREKIVEMSESFIKKYNDIFSKFYEMQDEIENLYNEAKNAK